VSKAYAIETLLRPAVEIWPALVGALAGSVAVVAPDVVMMTPGVAYGAATLLYGRATFLLVRAVRIVRYRRGLKRLPQWALISQAIPFSRRKLFLGKGFLWQQPHTQRLRDTLRPEAQTLLRVHPLRHWARRIETAWEHTPLLRHIARLVSHTGWWNPLAPSPDVGGNPALHAVGMPEGEADVWSNLSERVGHMLVVGSTRTGKTRAAEVFITQDIRRGDVVIVFDPKGDADLMRRVYAEARRAGRELFIFHLGYPDISARYNAIGDFTRITEVATRVASQLPSEGNSAAFKEFAWRFVNIIARALVALGKRPDYHLVRRYINDIEPLLVEYCRDWLGKHGPRDWRASVDRLRNNLNDRQLPLSLRGRSPDAVALVQYVRDNAVYDVVLEGLRSAFEYDKTYFDKIVSSVGPLMEKLTTGRVAELIAPDYFDLNDDRPIFDWMQVIRRNAVVYVGLDALSDPLVAGAVGNSMFADLCSVAGRLYKHGPDHGLPGETGGKSVISLHADEFNELIGDEFVPLINKGGGAGLQATVYTQTWADVEARLKSRAKAAQVAGNLNTLIMFRVKDLQTAEMLTNQVPLVLINSLMAVSGASDSSDPDSEVHFTSHNQDRLATLEVPAIAPDNVIQLPKGQAFALLEGGRLYKLRMPLPRPGNDPAMPADLDEVAREMRRRYSTGEHWYRDDWWQTAVAPIGDGITQSSVPTGSRQKTRRPRFGGWAVVDGWGQE